jgi:hypothetical protein
MIALQFLLNFSIIPPAYQLHQHRHHHHLHRIRFTLSRYYSSQDRQGPGP